MVHYDDLQVTRVGIDVIDSSYIQVSIIIAIVIQLLCIMLSTYVEKCYHAPLCNDTKTSKQAILSTSISSL